jgi:DNA-binding response OmpR family regulator
MSDPRVLIVDDELPLVRLLTQAFRQEGFQVSTAGNGIECMNKVAGFRPDVILMDIMMPRLDGIDATRLIRRQNGLDRTYVVALSARTDEGTKRKMMEAGADLYLEKPFVVSRLLESIRAHLGARR